MKTTILPLFPNYNELNDIILDDYLDIKLFLDSGPDWRLRNWMWSKDYLLYIGKRKSKHTFSRFRGEVEKFLLWCFLVHDKPVELCTRNDIIEYVDFCVKPSISWVSTSISTRFKYISGQYVADKSWRPFRVPHNKSDKESPIDVRYYRPSVQTIESTFVALSTLYNYLAEEGFCQGDPVLVAKRDCKHLIKNVAIKPVKRLSKEQWGCVMDAAENMASTDPNYERSLFIIATMKVCFLRVSEMSEWDEWLPKMGNFSYERLSDGESGWVLYVFGKGRKIRKVTVPLDYVDNYLTRYRLWRGLPALPKQDEGNLLLKKIKGRGGLTTRQISRLVQEVFDCAYMLMKKKHGPELAEELLAASTHYLRHTGASMEIERGRDLKQLSEELGHANISTTDKVYVQTDLKERMRGGKGRKVR